MNSGLLSHLLLFTSSSSSSSSYPSSSLLYLFNNSIKKSSQASVFSLHPPPSCLNLVNTWIGESTQSSSISSLPPSPSCINCLDDVIKKSIQASSFSSPLLYWSSQWSWGRNQFRLSHPPPCCIFSNNSRKKSIQASSFPRYPPSSCIHFVNARIGESIQATSSSSLPPFPSCINCLDDVIKKSIYASSLSSSSHLFPLPSCMHVLIQLTGQVIQEEGGGRGTGDVQEKACIDFLSHDWETYSGERAAGGGRKDETVEETRLPSQFRQRSPHLLFVLLLPVLGFFIIVRKSIQASTISSLPPSSSINCLHYLIKKSTQAPSSSSSSASHLHRSTSSMHGLIKLARQLIQGGGLSWLRYQIIHKHDERRMRKKRGNEEICSGLLSLLSFSSASSDLPHAWSYQISKTIDTGGSLNWLRDQIIQKHGEGMKMKRRWGGEASWFPCWIIKDIHTRGKRKRRWEEGLNWFPYYWENYYWREVDEEEMSRRRGGGRGGCPSWFP